MNLPNESEPAEATHEQLRSLVSDATASTRLITSSHDCSRRVDGGWSNPRPACRGGAWIEIESSITKGRPSEAACVRIAV